MRCRYPPFLHLGQLAADRLAHLREDQQVDQVLPDRLRARVTEEFLRRLVPILNGAVQQEALDRDRRHVPQKIPESLLALAHRRLGELPLGDVPLDGHIMGYLTGSGAHRRKIHVDPVVAALPSPVDQLDPHRLAGDHGLPDPLQLGPHRLRTVKHPRALADDVGNGITCHTFESRIGVYDPGSVVIDRVRAGDEHHVVNARDAVFQQAKLVLAIVPLRHVPGDSEDLPGFQQRVGTPRQPAVAAVPTADAVLEIPHGCPASMSSPARSVSS